MSIVVPCTYASASARAVNTAMLEATTVTGSDDACSMRVMSPRLRCTWSPWSSWEEEGGPCPAGWKLSCAAAEAGEAGEAEEEMEAGAGVEAVEVAVAAVGVAVGG